MKNKLPIVFNENSITDFTNVQLCKQIVFLTPAISTMH